MENSFRSQRRGLLPIRERPRNAETARAALSAPVTPSDAFYVRTNLMEPQLDAVRHRISVDGAVQRPLEVSLANLRELGERELMVTLECAGNSRLGASPLPPGEPWGPGALSTARFTGVPLAGLLARAGVQDRAIEILVRGADQGSSPSAPGPLGFARALPIDKALHPDTLLAFAMNGERLSTEHGAPLRLIVPGWYGMASVKWVQQIEALCTPFDGFFQRERYVYRAGGAEPQPVTTLRVKSLITTPQAGARLSLGPQRIRGWAWSGQAPIVWVEIALGADRLWQDALLDAPLGQYVWRGFELAARFAEPGRHTLRARATDASGAVQPEVAPYDELGYGNNAVETVVVDVG